MKPKRFHNITVELTGHDGNAFAVISRVNRAMRMAGCSPQEIVDWQREAHACKSYELLLTKIMDEFEYK